MPKAKKRVSDTHAWSATDHDLKFHTKKRTLGQQDRTARLSHGTRQKRDALKLQLHLTKTQRSLNDLRARLKTWDPQEEAAKKKQRQVDEAAAAASVEESGSFPKKKKGRKGPEAWTLKGAARPAWQVYDFDTRYVDPYVEAHQEAKRKEARCQNLLVLYQGQFATCETLPDECREYLGLLMQVGCLSQEAKQFKTARQAFLECIELEGDNNHPITAARESLMKLYIQLRRYEAAWRLGAGRFPNDDSVWVRYSTALASFHLTGDQTTTVADREAMFVRAIRSNVFCAYFLSFHDTFTQVMEYLEEFRESEDEPQSSFEEALEYCSSVEHVNLWLKTDGAVPTLRLLLTQGISGNSKQLNPSDIEWSDRLTKIEDVLRNSKAEDSDSEPLSDEKGVDMPMFINMFRTAMEMLADKGELRSG